MRRMSFALTKPQILDRSKTVTRRMGWEFLKPGDRIAAVEKAMGFRKGEKAPAPMAILEVVSVRREPLDEMVRRRFYGRDEKQREGFGTTESPVLPSLKNWVNWFAETHKCKPSDDITRIEFRYVDGGR